MSSRRAASRYFAPRLALVAWAAALVSCGGGPAALPSAPPEQSCACLSSSGERGCPAALRALGLAAAADDATDYDVTLAGLLCQAVDPRRLYRAPNNTYEASMSSSTDPRSTRPGAAFWHANVDVGNFVRTDGDEYVMAEVEGPGVITRIWSANPSGTLRIYLDGSEEPVVEAEMAALLGGELGGAFAPPLTGRTGSGVTLHTPIAFATGMRVTSDVERLYYHVGYRRYPETVRVQSFTIARAEALGAAFAVVATRLSDPAVDAGETREFVLGPSANAHEVLGSGVVRRLAVQASGADEATLRGVRLELSFDGVTTTRVPLGDFFGSGPGLNAHQSIMATVGADGLLELRWPMPFTEGFEVRIVGATVAVPELAFEVDVEDATHDDRLLYFHAQWTGATTQDTSTPHDLPLADVVGAGWLVGTVYNVTNPSRLWWGEGDERVYVDGERRPSQLGTGTEDYFGYAWCSNIPFAHPYVGQTRADGPRNHGHISLYRWRLIDAVPFDRSLRFDMEILHWLTGAEGVPMGVDATTYLYLSPPVEAPEPADALYVVLPPASPIEDGVAPGPYLCGP